MIRHFLSHFFSILGDFKHYRSTYNQKREGVIYHRTPLQPNRPSNKPSLWGPGTDRDLWSALPQILHNAQPKCTLKPSHTLNSHHILTHNSDHSHRACISFIKNCTETCYSCLKQICHGIRQSTKNSTFLSRNFEYIHTLAIALICYLTQLRQLHLY